MSFTSGEVTPAAVSKAFPLSFGGRGFREPHAIAVDFFGVYPAKSRSRSGKMHIERSIEPRFPPQDSIRLVLLTGARQTGKTTLLRQLYPTLTYINLDAPENRDALRSLSTFAWAKTVGDAIIDEAQKEPSVFEKVKFAFDAKSVRFTVLSGSAQILLLRSVREVLAGRVFLYELYPLMLCELAASPNTATPQPPLLARLIQSEANVGAVLNQASPRLMPEQQYYLAEKEQYLLTWGGMPALLGLNEADRTEWLRSYTYTYLERDMADLARLNDLSPFKTFQRLAALRSAQLLSYAELGRDAGVSADTARRYLEYLKISYQSVLLPPFSRNLTSRVVKTPKLYWLDVGLLRQMTGYHGDPTGPVFETYVVSEVYKWIKTSATEAELSFYRTRSGLELDLLIQTPRGILGMEIKSRQRVDTPDLYALREVAKALGSEWLGGLCVYRGSEIRFMGKPSIWAVPSSRLLSP